jgi:transposase-like protein
MEEDSKGTGLGNVIRIDDERVREHLGHIVRGTVEETLNAMLEAEADRLCNAGRYERTAARRDQRAGSYDRKLQTKAGAVTLKVPKLRVQTFETAIIERYRRRESSVEEALIEMYLAGVSVRRVEDITEALWGTRVSPGTVSNLNKKIYGQIEAWRNQPIEGEQPYLYLDGIVLKRSWAGEVRKSRCWWRSRSTATATARFSASSRAPRRTRPAGAASWPISRGAACSASS